MHKNKEISKTIEQAEELVNNNNEQSRKSKDVFSDIRYICSSTSLIVESLQKGMDVAQLPGGDIIITEIKVVNTQYTWNREKNKMVKVSQI